MPYPKAGDTKEAYISRFMGSPEAKADYQDEKQRYAVAISMWEHRNATGEAGWPKLYQCSFIEPGVVFYQDLGTDGETILVQKAALDKMARSFIGKPVINFVHKDVTPKTVADGEADGIVSKVWLNESDGWYWAEFLVWDELTQRNCESGAYSVSCAYEPTDVNSAGGTYHNLPYHEEVLDGQYTHLAVVANPRYEGARIFVNSKGGSKMSWKFWNKTGKKNAADLDPSKALVDVDGDKVSLQQLYDAVKPESSALEMADDTVFEVDGKEHTLAQLKDAHRSKMTAAKNAADEAKKKEDAEKEKKNGESEEELRRTDGDKSTKNDDTEEAAKKLDKETKEKEALERQQAADEVKKKEDEEKKNAADAEKKKEEERKNAGKESFSSLKNAAAARTGDPVGIHMVSPEDRIKAGSLKYGSTPAPAAK